jgi:hypothetical protein
MTGPLDSPNDMRWLNHVALVKDIRDGHEIIFTYYKVSDALATRNAQRYTGG